MAKEKSKAKEESKEVVKKKDDVPAVSASGIDMDMDAGEGQDFGTQDLAIPRFGIIQSLSPQRTKAKPEYIEGAEEGMFFENVGKRLFNGEKGIIVVPVAYRLAYLEWAPRDSGKGLVANHGADPTAFNAANEDEKGRRFTAEGNLISPTAEYFIFCLNEETGEQIAGVLSMSSVFLKHAKRWNAMINQLRVKNPKSGTPIQPPIYFQAYRLTAVPESNKSGSWFRHEIAPYKPLVQFDNEKGDWVDCFVNGSIIYNEAKKFRESISKGAVKVAEPSDEGTHTEESDEDPM